jgi:hypothetical protein
MRAVYRLLGLVRRYGDDAVNTTCGKALEADVVPLTARIPGPGPRLHLPSSGSGPVGPAGGVGYPDPSLRYSPRS